METSNSRGWFWIKNNESTQNRNDITGKYLFFSDDKNELIDLAKIILEKHSLLTAKTQSGDIPNDRVGFGFVLCVYDIENRYCNELKNLEAGGVSFRYWKSDNATRVGKYSKKFTVSR
jgi:hypothetical protein|tara:strand:- start:39554 stop:39907 length:354 start_codon:yes stop_codon:yes gene_type:complete